MIEPVMPITESFFQPAGLYFITLHEDLDLDSNSGSIPLESTKKNLFSNIFSLLQTIRDLNR